MALEKRRRKPVRRFLLKHVLPPIVLVLYRLLASTWRYHETNKEVFEEALASGRSVTAAFLHARTLQLLHYNSRPEHGQWISMASQSRDGELVARVEERMGYKVERGSSGAGGARALVGMIQALKRNPGWSSCLAVDGSRGPRGVVQPGIVTLAQKTGGLLLPVAASAHPALVYPWSWDRTVLPLPFARVEIVLGDPLEVPARLDPEALEGVRNELERRLLDLHARADELSGFRDSAPLRVTTA